MVKAQIVFTLATLAVANAFSPQQIPGNVSIGEDELQSIGRSLVAED